MKKVISLVLVLIMACGLVACSSSEEKVEQLLQGEWISRPQTEDAGTNFIFENGKGKAEIVLFGSVVTTNEFTYTINDNAIVVKYPDSTVELSYSLNGDTLVLEDGEYKKSN